jgi:hypothetical protein
MTKYQKAYEKFVSDSREKLKALKEAGAFASYNKLQRRRRGYHYNLWLASRGLDPEVDKTDELKEKFRKMSECCFVHLEGGFVLYNRGRLDGQKSKVQTIHEGGLTKPSAKKQDTLKALEQKEVCIYVWALTGIYNGGYKVYKIGITKRSRGVKRIISVAVDLGVAPDIVRLKPVSNALALEKHLLSFGRPVGITGFSGSSELRALSADELHRIKAIIDNAR